MIQEVSLPPDVSSVDLHSSLSRIKALSSLDTRLTMMPVETLLVSRLETLLVSRDILLKTGLWFSALCLPELSAVWCFLRGVVSLSSDNRRFDPEVEGVSCRVINKGFS